MALARFVGAASLIEGHIASVAPVGVRPASREVDTILGRLPLESADAAALENAGTVTVLVSPEQLAIVTGEHIEEPRRLTGRVVACEYYGHDAVVRVQPDGEPTAPHIIVRTSGGPQFPPGSPVIVRARGPVLAWTGSSA